MNSRLIESKLKKLPSTPGVYFYYDKNGTLIYVGKAAVLKHRVRSYFGGAHDNKTEKLISEIVDLKWQETASVIEALILESNLIKKHQPKYNLMSKDDKSFIQIAITDEEFPRVVSLRVTDVKNQVYKIKKLYGPFTSGLAVKDILAIFRRIFGFRDCNEEKFHRHQKKGQPCLYYPLRLCPAPCVSKISRDEYLAIIRQIQDFLEGKRKRVLGALKRQMERYSKDEEFEKAAIVRDRLFAFTHINDVAAIKQERPLQQIAAIPERIEAYDISNQGKDYAVGSMVVFTSGEIDKSQYRKFRIKTVVGQDDPAMLSEVLHRRFHHREWAKPGLILLDGGRTQLSAVLRALNDLTRTDQANAGAILDPRGIPVIAVAKGPTRKGYQLFRNVAAGKILLDRRFIESIRDEAHRFAINYHRKLKNII